MDNATKSKTINENVFNIQELESTIKLQNTLKDNQIAEYSQIIKDMQVQKEKDAKTIQDLLAASNLDNVYYFTLLINRRLLMVMKLIRRIIQNLNKQYLSKTLKLTS